MERTVSPEWLDHLPPADPRAMRSRHDLRRVNAIMRNAHIVARTLTGALEQPPQCIVELGAGDGAWMAQLACALPASWSGVRAVLLDRQDTVAGGTLAGLARRGWAPEVVTADAFDWLAEPGAQADVIVANLFLHHFETGPLRALLALIAARAGLFAACEPRRSSGALRASRLLGLIGCNAVTRHDAVVSVRAGFAGTELSASWPDRTGWRLEERAAGWFSHVLVAAST
jgi:hypothetical protein